MRKVYKGLAILNDVKAVRKGRIFPRIWNRLIMKITRRFLK